MLAVFYIAVLFKPKWWL